MSDDKALVPVWTLATGDVQVPQIAGNGPMTAERLAELRNVLAALADSPIATLEVHPLPDNLDRSRGIPLDAASPPLVLPLTRKASSDSAPFSTVSVGTPLSRSPFDRSGAGWPSGAGRHEMFSPVSSDARRGGTSHAS